MSTHSRTAEPAGTARTTETAKPAWIGRYRDLVAAATLAPSMHNTQPWKFVVDAGGIDVYSDDSRDLRIADPDHRARTISCGAALFNLRVAAAHDRLAVSVDSFPDGHDALAHIARLNVGDGEPDRGLGALFDAIAIRHTNRAPFTPEPIPLEIGDRLVAAVTAEGADLEWLTDPYSRYRLEELTAEATRSDTYDPRRRAERELWIGDPALSRRDGIPPVALGPRAHTQPLVGRDFGRVQHDALRPTEQPESHPTIAILSTTSDGPEDWLVAGQALQRLLLLATTYDLSASFLNAVLEYPDLRAVVGDPRGPRRKFQMIMRMGHGRPTAQTPRRPVAEVLQMLGGSDDGPA
jgi:Nitroreductase family